jgi:hypothetical protein
MAAVLKFESKDLGKRITDEAGLARIKFDKVDKISVDASVQADELHEKMTGKQWSDLEKKLKSLFDDLVKDLEKSVAKHVEKANDDAKSHAPDTVSLFLKPINIQLEDKFEKHCTRIHQAFEKELKDLKKSHDAKKDAKINIGFDFAILESSERRVISSSSSALPGVDTSKADTAAKTLDSMAEYCKKLAEEADTKADRFRSNLKALEKDFEPKHHLEDKDLAVLRQDNGGYRDILTDLEKALSELHDALVKEAQRQDHWKKEYGKAKDKTGDQNKGQAKDIKDALTTLNTTLKDLIKEAEDVRKDVAKDAWNQEKIFADVLASLKDKPVEWPKRRTDAALATSFSVYSRLKGFLNKVETGANTVRDSSQDLKKAAATK